MHSFTKLATIKENFKSQSTQKHSVENSEFSVFQMIDKVSELEKINETFHFKFKKEDESVKHVTNNSALYISIKRAFTPYAVIQMLRQIQIAYTLKDSIKITEKFPLLFYTLEHSDTKLMIKSGLHSQGLHNLQCTCQFFVNYNLICWH